MVGLSIAKQLLEKNKKFSIIVIDKEKEIGLHSSGRNSGVLHAGIYYKPGSLKAKVCIKGAIRLKQWCKENNLEVLECGKVIAVQDPELDQKLDFLYDRGKKNGADISLINEDEFARIVPNGRTATGRAIWSPKTSVVAPKKILQKLLLNLSELNVRFIYESQINKVDKNSNCIFLSTGQQINFGHLFNVAGLQADKVAKKFNIGENFIIYPFKGIYWELNKNCNLNFKTNLYPVPDLNVPFLGIHVTPGIDGKTYLGPTAIPAFGRENYRGFENFEPISSIKFLSEMAKLFYKNSKGFRKYATQQAFQGLKPLFLSSAKKLIPDLTINDLVLSKKVGIRSQLYDKSSLSLIDDFKMISIGNSTHLLNAISPAFTASFELADLILENLNL